MNFKNSLLIIFVIKANIIHSCDLPKVGGYILTKYYRPNCPYSIKIIPVMEKIERHLEKAGVLVTVRYKNCDTCQCKTDDRIITVPTLTINLNGVEINRHRGSGDYKTYADFIVKNTRISEIVFFKKKQIQIFSEENLENLEKELKGPSLVYFYKNEDKEILTILEEAAQEFIGRAEIAKIDVNKYSNIIKKFNIQKFPFFLGIFDDVYEPFHHKITKERIKKFLEDLIKPGFEEVNKNELLEITKKNKNPVFIVLHLDSKLANHYFKKLAHLYKFQTKILQSSDQALFETFKFWPKKHENDKIIKENEKIRLFVYKEGEIHEYSGKFNEYNISEWIFHSHFPHLIHVRNINFHSIFHGFKPVIFLVSLDEKLLDVMENVGREYQISKPYGKYIFAYVDAKKYSSFIQNLIPKLEYPCVIIFNPQKQLFYHLPGKLKNSNFRNFVKNLINKYETGKIEPYLFRKTNLTYVFIVLISLIVIIGIMSRTNIKTNKD